MRAVPAGARPKVTEVREEGGFGLTGLCAGAPVAFGRPELFERLGISAPPPPAHDGPIAGASRDGVFLGWLLSTDAPRPEAAAELGELRILGLTRQVLLTGDRTAVARRIGAEPGIPEVCAEVLPEQKMHRVQQETRNGFPPLVVGDGINDSLALKAGAVGIAMGAQGPLTPRSCLGRLTGLASLADAANGDHRQRVGWGRGGEKMVWPGSTGTKGRTKPPASPRHRSTVSTVSGPLIRCRSRPRTAGRTAAR